MFGQQFLKKTSRLLHRLPAPARDIPVYLQLWRDGRLPLELLPTDTKPLAEINEGLDALTEGRVVRRLVVA
ncbi:hypothetical protein ACIQTW_10270 [Paenarthrobacter sp. NPDC090517]|uniref:hypothetical protein n=1 Tax=Paenarthrobacter sp. NPDC090517 TaxID=3364381 RepID=UPI00380E7BEB